MGRPRKHDKHLPACVFFRHGAYHLVKRGKWVLLGRELGPAMQKYAELIGDKTDKPIGGSLDPHIDRAMRLVCKGLAASTVKQYGLAAAELKHMMRFIPEPAALRQRDVIAIKRELVETPNYANRIISLLRSICNVWLEDDLIESNPAIGIKRYAEPERERLITVAEFRAIREKAGDRLQVLMDLWYLTGQRVSDVLKIRHSDLLADGIAFKQQKTGARLIVEWNEDLEWAVQRAREVCGTFKTLTLLNNRFGKALDYSSIKAQWNAACKAAKVKDAQIRDLRAMSGTDAQDQGKNPSKLLGHKFQTTTARYLRSKVVPVVEGPRLASVSNIGHASKTREKKDK